MSELFKELQEDIRTERMQNLWKAFGKFIVLGSVGIVALTIAFVVLQNHKREVATEHTAKLLAGLDRMKMQDYRGATANFDALSADSKSPYYGISLLFKAQAQTALGQTEEAKQSYNALAADPSPYGAVAKLVNASHGAPVIVPPRADYPLYQSLTEWKAWQLLEEGKKDEAVELFSQLHFDVKAPESMRERMREVLQYLAPQKLVELYTPSQAKN